MRACNRLSAGAVPSCPRRPLREASGIWSLFRVRSKNSAGGRNDSSWALTFLTGVEETTYMENDLLGLEREWTPNVETITYIRDNEGNVLGQKNADGSSVAPKR